MTLFDYLVLFVLVCSVIVSTLRGLMKEALSLISWVVAFVVANTYSELLAELLPEVVPGPTLRLILAFVALFIGARLLMMLLTMAVDAIVKAGGLTVIDRGLGMVFGLARGALIVVAAVLICGMTELPQQEFWRLALFRPTAEIAARTVMPYLPSSFAARIQF